jgi:hypothetical protein
MDEGFRSKVERYNFRVVSVSFGYYPTFGGFLSQWMMSPKNGIVKVHETVKGVMIVQKFQ